MGLIGFCFLGCIGSGFVSVFSETRRCLVQEEDSGTATSSYTLTDLPGQRSLHPKAVQLNSVCVLQGSLTGPCVAAHGSDAGKDGRTATEDREQTEIRV